MRSKWRKVGQDSVRKLLLEPGILSVDMITPDKTCEILWQSLCLKYSTDGYTHAPALPHLGVWRLVPSGLQRPLLRYHEWNEITRCGNSAWGVRIWEGFVFCLSRVLCHLPSYFSPCLSLPFKFHHMCACEYWFHWVDAKLHDPGFDLEEIVHCLTVRLASRRVFSARRYSASLPVLCLVMDLLPARSFHTPGTHTNESHICSPVKCRWLLLGTSRSMVKRYPPPPLFAPTSHFTLPPPPFPAPWTPDRSVCDIVCQGHDIWPPNGATAETERPHNDTKTGFTNTLEWREDITAIWHQRRFRILRMISRLNNEGAWQRTQTPMDKCHRRDRGRLDNWRKRERKEKESCGVIQQSSCGSLNSDENYSQIQIKNNITYQTLPLRKQKQPL